MRLIPAEFLDPAATMVVYTPAVPQEHSEYRYFADHGFRIEKRSQMLGHLAEAQVRDGCGGNARQDYDVDARGMAEPRP